MIGFSGILTAARTLSYYNRRQEITANNLATAELLYDKAIQANPMKAEAYFLRASCLTYLQGDLQRVGLGIGYSDHEVALFHGRQQECRGGQLAHGPQHLPTEVAAAEGRHRRRRCR